MLTSVSDAREQLTSLALELGFEATGWADAAPRPGEIAAYQDWLGSGRQAGMDYLSRQLPRRADLNSSLAGAGSVLVLGVSHAFAPQPVPAGGVRLGRVARYAWTPDYHAQLEPLLEQLYAETTTPDELTGWYARLSEHPRPVSLVVDWRSTAD